MLVPDILGEAPSPVTKDSVRLRARYGLLGICNARQGSVGHRCWSPTHATVMPRTAHTPSADDVLDGLRTPDGRYLVVRGRLWRASNPALDDAVRDRWVKTLMEARRAIGSAMRQGDAMAQRRARQRMHRAKVALGERGAVWWDDGAPDENRRLADNTRYAEWFARARRGRQAIEALLDQRQPSASICPSEVARVVSPRGWRAHLEEVRDLGRHLAQRGEVVITQRGRRCDPYLRVRGPVRYRRP